MGAAVIVSSFFFIEGLGASLVHAAVMIYTTADDLDTAASIKA